MAAPESHTALSRLITPCAGILLVLLAAAGFLHLGADFPNHSRWIDDAAKFTDEGWYASGALNHHLTGHWLRPGDFNPMVTIPVWSILLAAVFHFTGISLPLARGIAFLFTLGAVAVAGRLISRDHPRLAPILMLLLLSSPILYAFSRIAILEPPLLFFLSAAALAAFSRSRPSNLRLILCGILFVLAMLTKSSAVFAAPAILYLLWFQHRTDRRELLRVLAVPLATVATIYGAYWLLAVRTHPADVRVLYGQNAPYLGLKSIEKAVRIVYRSFTWVDQVLFPLAVAAVLLSLMRRFRTLWRDPLFGFSVVAYAGYSGFLLVHFDAGPRYFAILVLPVTLIVLLFLDNLRKNVPRAAVAVTALVAIALTLNVVSIVRTILHPTYTLRDADLAVRNQIDRDLVADPSATPLVLGHGAMESTFITQIPALDDLGEATVAEKLATARPGWLVTYSDNLELTTRPGVAGRFTFTEEGRYFVLDSPSRQYLLLYRIQPK